MDRFERFLDDLELVLDQPSSHRPVLLGHSLGGLIALDYVLDQRSRPSALVLSAPVLDLAVPAWKRAAARVAGRVLPRIRFPNAIRGDQLSRDPAVGERYLADRLVGRHTSAGLGVEMLEAMSRVRRRADGLPVPTLVLHGGDDSLVPPEATAWLADLDGVERLLYPSLRHELFNEPEWMQVLEDVLGWLRTH